MRTRLKQGKGAVIRPLDPGDPRSLSHPSHREQWLALAEEIGRMEAREEYALMKQQRAAAAGRKRHDDEKQ